MDAERLTVRERLRRLLRESSGFRMAAVDGDSVNGWLARQEAECLYLLASQQPFAKAIVEIGSYQGKSTVFLAYGARAHKCRVYAVDPHTGDRGVLEGSPGVVLTETLFRNNITRLGLEETVSPMVMRSTEAAAQWNAGTVGLLFVDGWHSEEAVVEDGSVWSAYLNHDSIVLFDDWLVPEVYAGIRHLIEQGLVPPTIGSVGKVLICANKRTFGARFTRILSPRVSP